MNRIIILSFVIIALVGVVFVVIFSLPEKQIACQSNDGLCPKQCNYESDKDCLKSRTTTLGEVRHCITDNDCAAVKPFCGNPVCTFIDNECLSGQQCATAIGRDYLAAWNAGRVKCLEPIKAECRPLEDFRAKCVIGECRIVGTVA